MVKKITKITQQVRVLFTNISNVSEGSMKKWVKKYGWKEIENGLIFISNQDENIKTKNISEEICFEKLVDILNVH